MRLKKHTLQCALCLVMSVLMLLGAVLCVNAAQLDEAQTGAGEVVYFENNSNWSTVYCYMWSNGGGNNGEWPGQQMTKVSGNLYMYNVPGDYDMIIFNNGNSGNGNQTGDMSFPGTNKLYNSSTNSWSDYSGPTEAPTSAPTSSPTSAPTSAPTQGGNTDTKKVYCKNSANWGSVYCYMWSDGTGDNGTWPGKQMTSIGDNVYEYEVTGNWNMIIFNNGSDNAKTEDMSFPGAGYIYDNSTKQWTVYDVSPIRVTNCGADAVSPQYVGTDITLSTSATSTGGAVSYKISVTKGGSTSVLSNFSAKNSVVWTPNATGTYTVTFDYKDAAGNTNQRTLSFEVLTDSGVAEPILKGISPKPGEILKGSAQTFSVNASGGKTGTNYLYYKFTVKNSNSEINNVPYYTATPSFKFTPSTTGIYSLTVAVQNNDNVTVERTYVYTCVTSLTPTETPTVTPTTPTTKPTTPTTAPTTAPGDYLKGDANGDGDVSVVDATTIQRFNAQIISTINRLNADIDGDGEVSVIDATKIQRFLAQLEPNW